MERNKLSITQKDWKKFESNNKSIALNILYVPCNLRYKTPKEISMVFHNGSIYDYLFIIKELAEEFEGKFECLRENAEKHITFTVPIKKYLTMVNQLHTK